MSASNSAHVLVRLPGAMRDRLKNTLAEIGEAVKLLPPELLAKHPTVDWRGWAGLRDINIPSVFQFGIVTAATHDRR